MNAHAHRPLTRHLSGTKPLGRFAAWVNAKRRARRARRLQEETVVCLSAMDAKLANDIGMDIDRLSEIAPETPDVTEDEGSAPPLNANLDKQS
ncbi:MAG: hypothetical protein AB7F09_04735 [Parvibaculaceae bacterium]